MSTKPWTPMLVQLAANNERITAVEAEYRCAAFERDDAAMTAAREKLHSLIDQKLDLSGAAVTKMMRGEM
jgi:hypothetical protein